MHPVAFFVKGRLPQFEKGKKKKSRPRLSLGARWASHVGLSQKKKETAGALALEGIPVISGMASGIDGAAQEAALWQEERAMLSLDAGRISVIRDITAGFIRCWKRAED